MAIAKNASALYRLSWILLLAAFAVCGLRGILKAEPMTQTDGNGPDCMIGAFLRDMQCSGRPPRTIAAAFEKMPPSDAPIAVVWPSLDLNMSIVNEMVSYLAWPRRTLSVPVDKHDIAPVVRYLRKSRASVIVFYIFKPPPLENSTVSGQLTIVPLEEKSK